MRSRDEGGRRGGGGDGGGGGGFAEGPGVNVAREVVRLIQEGRLEQEGGNGRI